MHFESDDAAKVVVETVHNYLFGARFLVCQFMSPGRVHKELFKEWDIPFNQPSFPAVK